MFKTEISKIKLDSYIFNASGPNNSTLKELEIIAKSGSSAIMMKSCTIEPRKGNPNPRYKRLVLGSIQSMGLPNLGYQKYIEFVSKLKKYNKPIIASVAGFCGDYIKPVALGNVRAFYELLKNKVSIIGVGGIKSGLDAFEFLLTGADAVQVATIFEKEGSVCFRRINRELDEILRKKGYKSIKKVKGNLKFL